MHICFFAHAASIHTQKWLEYFRHHGHQVSLVSLTPGSPPPGVDYHPIQHSFRIRYEQSNWHYLLQTPRLWQIVRHIQPDLVNAHFLSSYGFLAALVTPAQIPLAISLHGSDIQVIPRRSFVHAAIARFALRRARLVISVSRPMTRVLQDYLPARPPEVLTTQYGVRLDQFYPPATPPVEPLFTSNRGLVSTSNLETALQAAQILAGQGSPLRLLLAGGGEKETALRGLAQKLNLQARVEFLGPLAHPQMPELLRRSPLYISTSLSDGASIALLEAMACGCFPVVADIPANREWIEDGQNGFLFPPASPEALAAKLNLAWQQPELRKNAARLNAQIIRERGEYLHNMGQIENAFLRLVQQTKG